MAGNSWNDRNFRTAILERVIFKDQATITESADIPLSREVTIIDASGGDVTATLPDPADAAKLTFVVKRAETDSTGNTATVARNDAENINGSASDLTLAAGEIVRLLSDGTDWNTI